MQTTISVPVNTMLADLDESLRELLKRELGRHGFDGVDIVFDAPTKEWAAGLSSPTVNLFLYDLRENLEKRDSAWQEDRSNGRAGEQLNTDTNAAPLQEAAQTENMIACAKPIRTHITAAHEAQHGEVGKCNGSASIHELGQAGWFSDVVQMPAHSPNWVSLASASACS